MIGAKYGTEAADSCTSLRERGEKVMERTYELSYEYFYTHSNNIGGSGGFSRHRFRTNEEAITKIAQIEWESVQRTWRAKENIVNPKLRYRGLQVCAEEVKWQPD